MDARRVPCRISVDANTAVHIVIAPALAGIVMRYRLVRCWKLGIDATSADDAARAHQLQQGACHNGQIQPQRAMSDVPEIELDSLGPAQRVAPSDLRQSRQARKHFESST